MQDDPFEVKTITQTVTVKSLLDTAQNPTAKLKQTQQTHISSMRQKEHRLGFSTCFDIKISSTGFQSPAHLLRATLGGRYGDLIHKGAWRECAYDALHAHAVHFKPQCP